MPNPHQLVARDRFGQVLSGATLRAFDVTFDAQGVPVKGALTENLYDSTGANVNQSAAPLAPSDVDGVMRFQLTQGFYWLEISKGPDLFVIRAFASGTASARDVGADEKQVPDGQSLAPALAGRPMDGNDDDKVPTYQHSSGQFVFRPGLPPVGVNQANRVLRVNTLGTETFWDIPDEGVVYPVEGLQLALLNESRIDENNTAGRILVTTNTNGGRTMILPAQSQSAVRVGAVFTIVNKGPSYVITFTPGTNVTINGGTNDWELEDFGTATLFKIADDDWVISGATEVTT